MTTKQVSVRLPLDLFQRLNEKKGRAGYIIQAVEEKIQRDEQEALAAGLMCLANNPEANDISDFAAPQAKVISHGD